MSLFRLIGAYLWALALQPGSTALAYDGFDSYDRRDPGSYWQGSGPAPAYAPGYASEAGRDAARGTSGNPDSDWYSSDWYNDQISGSGWDGWRSPDSGTDLPRAPHPATGSQPSFNGWLPEAPARGGYLGDPDSSPRRHDNGGDAADGWGPYRPPSYPPGQYRSRSDGGYAGSGPNQWRTPTGAPRYRFRSDPKFEAPDDRGVQSGYRFRPLTAREAERHRKSRDTDLYGPVPRDRQAAPPPGRGESFGYEPDHSPDDFFHRYYRGGP